MPELIFGLLAVLSSVLFIRERTLRKNSSKDIKIQNEQNLEKNYQILDNAVKKSDEILDKVSLDADKSFSDNRFFHKKLESQVEQELKEVVAEGQKTAQEFTGQAKVMMNTSEAQYANFLQQLQNQSHAQVETSLAQFANFLSEIKQKSEKAEVANWEGTRVRVEKLFENFETKLADFLLQSEQKMMLAVDLELRSARQLIDTYKVQQMTLVDENIIAMLEKTMSLVLAKNLTLKDQMDFVYESLEKAKAETFIV